MKHWYKNSIVIITLIILFFPVGLFLMWKYAGWNKKVKWIVTSFFVFVILISLIPGKSVKNSSPTKQATVSTTATPATTKNPSPTTTVKPSDKPASSALEKIEKLAIEEYPNFEVTVWNKNSDFASEGQTPYEVILNGLFNKVIASDCDGAKKLSYYMLESLYKDNDIRPTLSRVMITIPNYLRVSLGASDGVPMAQDGSFSGPTNFWTVMKKMGLGENERGELKNRTWGNYLTNCDNR